MSGEIVEAFIGCIQKENVQVGYSVIEQLDSSVLLGWVVMT